MKSRVVKFHPQDKRRREGKGREWIGGCLKTPFAVMDREEPYRAILVLWFELPDGLIVGHEIVQPENQDGALGRTLSKAIAAPLMGPPRRPTHIRVAELSLAQEVREAVGDEFPIEVAPTPELDKILEAMAKDMPGDAEGGLAAESGYAENGRISPGLVLEFFEAAEELIEAEPWKVASEEQLLRMDIPELGVEGACVSIIGELGECPGLLILPSERAFEILEEMSEKGPPAEGPMDMGVDLLELTFDSMDEISAAARREVEELELPLGGDDAYPRLMRRERDGVCLPLVEKDLEIATICARAVSAYISRHPEIFTAEEFNPVCESYTDENDREVYLTAPYEAYKEFDLDAQEENDDRDPLKIPKVGRIEPCRCGSGKKYKHCHLRNEGAESTGKAARSPWHGLDRRVVRMLTHFADSHFGDGWWGFVEDFENEEDAAQLSIPWSVYQYHVDGRSIAETYLELHGWRCTPAERSWIESQSAAWLSVWEVIEVEQGRSVTLCDLLSGEKRQVPERTASSTLGVRDAVLARIVDYEGNSILSGLHPHPLPPIEAADLVRRARGRLRRKRDVPPERLRDPDFGGYLIRRWEEAVFELMEAAEFPPELHNTDGDLMILTTDHFKTERGKRSRVKNRLSELDDVEVPDSEDPSGDLLFLRSGGPTGVAEENTILGRAVFSGSGLRLETNSIERADALRKRVEQACGDLIGHQARTHADLSQSLGEHGGPGSLPNQPGPEMRQIAREWKRRHYEKWIDMPIPALDDLTPREAARTAAGRRKLDVLLKDMENHEQRLPEEDRYDFGELRRSLKLGIT